MKNIEIKKEAFAELLEVIETLREKCPWDKKQTIESLRELSIEEVYELADAIIAGDINDIRKELGDIAMHIVFYAKIAEEQGHFDISDVLRGVVDKLKFRHPHVYGDVNVVDENDVKKNWEQLKLKEKDGNKRVLDGVPVSLPALIKAFRIQDKARAAGFDWKDKADVWSKVKEEIDEFEHELKLDDTAKMEEEFGDLLFSIINASRLYGINPDTALERTNRKFIQRFNYLENQVKESGRSLTDLEFEEMEEIWQDAKKISRLP